MNWKRLAIWIGSIILVLIVLLVVAAILLTRTDALHRYILARTQQSVSQSLGARVQIRDFNLAFFPINLDLNDATIYGSGAEPTAPLLHVDHVGIGIRIISLIHRKWQLSDVQVDHPVAHVFIDKAGNSNLPRPQSSNSQTNLFDLAVRHAAINNGEIYYNDRKSILNADLHEVQFNSFYDPSNGGRYFGDLGYREGHLQFGDYAPMPHALQAHFDALRSGMVLNPVVLSSGPLQFNLNASLQDYTSPVVHATYKAIVATNEMRRILKNASLPLGVIHLSGNLQYRSEPNRPLLQTLALDGNLSSPSLRVHTPQLTTDVTNIGAKYTIAEGNASIRDLRANILGGELTARLSIRDLSGNSRSHLQAELRGVSLTDLNPVVNQMANSPSIQPITLSGTANANADATWGKTLNDLVATADAEMHAAVAPRTTQSAIVQTLAQATSTDPLPLDAVIHAHYVAARRQIALTNSSIRTPQTSIDLNGTVSDRSALQVRIVSNNLHELETIADVFRKPTPGRPVQPLGLSGKASFTGAVSGTTAAPHITGQLLANDLQVRSSSWKLIRTNVDLDPSRASLQNGIAKPASQGKVAFDVQAGLRRWSYTPSSPINLSLNASQLSVADLLHAAGSNAAASGILNANVSVHGSQLSPIGEGTATLTQARFSGEPVQSLNVRFQGTGEVVHATLSLRIPAGTANGNLTYYPKQEGYEGLLQAANLRLDQIHTLRAKNLQVAGLLSLSASGRGTLKDPGLQATVTVPQLSIRNQNVSNFRLQANVQNKKADIALDSNAINTTIRGRAEVALTGDYQTNATLDTSRIPLQPLAAMYAPAQAGDIKGETELHATLSGPLKNKSLVQAHLEIPVLTAVYKAVQLGAVAPIRADYSNGTATLQPAELRGTGTDLHLQGSFPTNGSTPASVKLLGTVDLRLLQIADPTLDSSGQLRLDINSFGSSNGLNTQGQIQIVNASMASVGSPISLERANGLLTLRNNRLEITQFQGSLGGGNITASGGIIYRPTLQFDVALAVNGVRVAYPQGVRTALDANLALSGGTDNSLLRGQVRIEGLYFTPDFDVTSFATQFTPTAPPAPSGGFTQNLQLDVAVDSTQLNAVSRTASLKGSANLRLSGTVDQPVVLGRVNLTGGDLLLMGNRYIIQGGTVAFVNAVETQPVLNVEASTTIQQYNIQLRFQGPLDRLRTQYTSDPALPPVDIIHLLAFGSTTESAAANSTPGNLGAESVLAQGLSSQVTSRIQKVAGISHLSVDPTLGTTNQTNPGARISVQQRVTSNLFVTLETDVTSTQHQVIQLQYQLNPRWSVNTTRDQNGGFGFDVRVHKTF